MIEAVNEFFMLVGAETPETLMEFFPWFMQILVGLVLVQAVFRLIGGIAGFAIDWKRFK